MKNRIQRKIAALVMPVLLLACAPLPKEGTALTTDQRAEAQKSCIAQYTAVGAVGGALVGMLISGGKDRWQGALIGGAAGGALAYSIAWGKCLKHFSDLNSFPVADARQTAATIGYEPRQGNLVRIERFTVTPQQVAPGGSLDLAGSYYVMSPDGQRDVKVVETRTVHFYDAQERSWKELGSEETALTAAQGTRRADGRTGMPTEVAEGRYRVTFKVAALGREDTASQEIVIRKS